MKWGRTSSDVNHNLSTPSTGYLGIEDYLRFALRAPLRDCPPRFTKLHRQECVALRVL